jgi:uncharacterized repeat protein (TIGR01451 family)
MKARSFYGSNKIRLILTLLIGALSASAITFGDTVLAPIGFAHEGSSLAKLDPTVQVVGNPKRLSPGKLPGLTSPSMFAFQTTIDDSGPDDEPGQKDLNSMAVDFGAPGATSFLVKWNWDNTATSGNNTRDGGALFDTDGDGMANYSLYITVKTDGSWVTQLYVCTADSRADRCGGPALVNTFASTSAVSIVAGSDPFGATPSHTTGNTCSNRPGCYTADTVANVNAVLADYGNPANITLLNVCSYPSGEPNSDPSDCVVEQAPGFLTLVKVVNNFGQSGAGYKVAADFPLTINGTSTTSGAAVPVVAGTYTIAETSQTGYTVGTWDCNIKPDGQPGSVSATVTIASGENVICTMTNTLIANPAINLVKTASTANFSNPPVAGNKITYSFAITNTGNVTLSGVDLDDALVGFNNATCGVTSLVPGASTNCTADYTLLQSDINAGTVSNTATACGDPPAGAGNEVCNTKGTTTPITRAPNLSILKTASPTTYNAVGQVITYTIVATNTGNVTLNNVAVTDGSVADLDCNPNIAGNQTTGFTLAPQGTLTCSATHTITQADLDNGTFQNTACVDDGAGGAAQKCDSETVTGVPDPKLSIVKADNDATYDSVGDVITYTIVAKNEGNVTLAAVTVTDALATLGICTPANGSSLAPQATMTCTATYTVTQADIDAGSHLNTACVDDGAAGASQVCDDEDTPSVRNPSLLLVKTARIKVITYSFVITNSGNTTLSLIGLTDPLFESDSNPTGQVSGCTAASLAPGATAVCEADYTVTQEDYENGFVTNIATATAAGGVITTATVTMTPLIVVSPTPTPTP